MSSKCLSQSSTVQDIYNFLVTKKRSNDANALKRHNFDGKALEALIWIDTRDMCADGLTKGSVDRTLIHAVMNGTWTLLHESKCWSSNRKHQPKHVAPTNQS